MKIQIAFDFNNISDSEIYLEKINIDGNLIFEYGAPMVVNLGVPGFVSLNSKCQQFTYVDCKTMDFPGLEWAGYVKSGATEITGMLMAEETVLAEMAEMHCSGAVRVCVSTMGYPGEGLTSRVQKLVDIGMDTFVVHAAHSDRQKAFSRVRKQLDEIAMLPGIRLFAAGGIGNDNLRDLRGYNIERIIVGRGVSKNRNPRDSISEMIEICSTEFA